MTSVPDWLWEIVAESARERALTDAGVLWMQAAAADTNVARYRALGGAHFFERANVPFAMSALDTPIYHAFMREFTPPAGSIVFDIGGGDGRNAWPWLQRGYRVVVVDAAGEALLRLRARIASHDSAWLERAAFVEADVRELPFISGTASIVLAVESLYYLNEDYERGLDECLRMLAPAGTLILSERDYEGGLVGQLLYRGLEQMLLASQTRSIWDGLGEEPMRTRAFTEAELKDLLAARNATVVRSAGTPLLSLLIGWLRGRGEIAAELEHTLPALRRLLETLSSNGHLRRCHLIAVRQA